MVMSRMALAVGLLALAGCESVSYLDPAGTGEARTVGGLCPYPYRVLDIPVPNNDTRIYVNAFGANEYAREATTIFLVVSDSRVWISHLVYANAPRQKHTHKVSFPEGMTIQVTAHDGQAVSGAFTTVSDGEGGTAAVILKFPFSSGREVTRFSVDFPAVVVDGERVEIGRVDFTPARATIYGINC
jgi:hypothetical protein